MACKCKEESYSSVKKYSDDGKPVLEQIKGVKKVLFVIFRVIFGVLLSAIVIVMLPLTIVYVVFASLFGKGLKINIKKILNNGRK